MWNDRLLPLLLVPLKSNVSPPSASPSGGKLHLWAWKGFTIDSAASLVEFLLALRPRRQLRCATMRSHPAGSLTRDGSSHWPREHHFERRHRYVVVKVSDEDWLRWWLPTRISTASTGSHDPPAMRRRRPSSVASPPIEH
jgi:hypothetical protein